MSLILEAKFGDDPLETSWIKQKKTSYIKNHIIYINVYV